MYLLDEELVWAKRGLEQMVSALGRSRRTSSLKTSGTSLNSSAKGTSICLWVANDQIIVVLYICISLMLA